MTIVAPRQRGQSLEIRNFLREVGFTENQVFLNRNQRKLILEIIGNNRLGPFTLENPISLPIFRQILQKVGIENITTEVFQEALLANTIRPPIDLKNNLEEDIFDRVSICSLDNTHTLDLVRARRNPAYMNSRELNRHLDLVSKTSFLLENDLKKIKDEEIVLILGPTRAGKTTTMFYLGGSDIVSCPAEEAVGGENAIEENVFVTGDDNGGMVGHGIEQSHTFFPYIHDRPMVGTNLKLMDFPGFFDTSGWQFSLSCDLVLRKIFELAKTVRILLIFNFNDLDNGAAANITNTIQKLKKYIHNLDRHCLVGFTNKENNFNNSQVNIIQRLIGPNMEYLRIHQIDNDLRPNFVKQIIHKLPVKSLEEAVEVLQLNDGNIGKFGKRLQDANAISTVYTNILQGSD